MLKMVGPDLGGKPLALVLVSFFFFFLVRSTTQAVADTLGDAWAKGLSLPSRTTQSYFTEVLGGIVREPDRRVSRSGSVLCRYEPAPRGGMYRTSVSLGTTLTLMPAFLRKDWTWTMYGMPVELNTKRLHQFNNAKIQLPQASY